MSTIGVSTFRSIGRVLRIIAVKVVHLLTILSLLASGLPGPRIHASASGMDTSFQEPTSPQSSKASHQKAFLLTFFERLKLSTRRNASLDCELYPIAISADSLSGVTIG